MNAIERTLSDDLLGLMDRLATAVPEGAIDDIRSSAPTLRTRLEQMEATLAGTRAELLEDYQRWLRALDDLENLWALAAWQRTLVDPDERPTSLAA